MTTQDRTSTAPREPLPAKRPRSLLAGPYGHPFHPITVTLPIGAWTASLVFDLAALGADSPRAFADGAFWLILIGIAGAVVAALVGLMDMSVIPRGTRAFRTVLTHSAMNVVVIGLFGVGALLRAGGPRDDVTLVQVGLSVAALAVLGASGWLGGKLSHRYGVRVADEVTQAHGYGEAPAR